MSTTVIAMYLLTLNCSKHPSLERQNVETFDVDCFTEVNSGNPWKNAIIASQQSILEEAVKKKNIAKCVETLDMHQVTLIAPSILMKTMMF